MSLSRQPVSPFPGASAKRDATRHENQTAGKHRCTAVALPQASSCGQTAGTANNQSKQSKQKKRGSVSIRLSTIYHLHIYLPTHKRAQQLQQQQQQYTFHAQQNNTSSQLSSKVMYKYTREGTPKSVLVRSIVLVAFIVARRYKTWFDIRTSTRVRYSMIHGKGKGREKGKGKRKRDACRPGVIPSTKTPTLPPPVCGKTG